ncbi:PREDICTED: conserved oligomeric Golgi complex subunit 7-like [Amphimedon queenslandica]|uniref:Conserved oligomeric Golgi complex subunit 7 n=2 Tax=Amphimedon queenslandica TaxID=400682 RepID=A0AAN0IYH5_AMPQE|nr:PREDICTED: conserved oligomeric Golgi complex subunit 7-like [Amphimedon queenslandica]|eukprot:XP_019849814.1 PREDICTED: conserved oligomeric Golgi complex subunit 7-like [Amphimedon queenslandica]
MDISKFSDPDFDVKEWVNGALRLPKDSKTSVDAHASMLVMKLQLFIQEVNNVLEETGGQVVQSLPRILRDVEAVRQEALLLRDQMLVVKEDIKKVETETLHSMQRLVELDSVKTRMQDTQQALQEADNWATLVLDVEQVFETQDVDQISEKVIRMQQSLNVLHDVPDYEDRRKLLESLKNRLEALLSPKLITSFNNHNTIDAQRLVDVFKGMEREGRVKEYYIQCHKNTVQQLWQSLQDKKDTSLRENLNTLYNELLSKWQLEMGWCSQVFTSSLGMLVKVFGESMNALSSSLGQSLHGAVHKSQEPVTTLIELRHIVLKFLKNFSKSLQSVDLSVSGPILFPLVESIHLPYCQLLVQYGSFQQQALMKTLFNINMIDANFDETLRTVSSTVSNVMSSSHLSIENCLQLTQGWGIVSVIKAIEAYLVQFTKKLSLVLQDLQGRYRQAKSETGSETGRNGFQDDWSSLQWIFQFIQHCGDFLLRVSAFNSSVCSQVLSLSDTYTSPANSQIPFNVFDYLSIYHPEEHTAVIGLLGAIEKNGDGHVLLPATTNQIQVLVKQAHTLAFDVVFSQLKQKLIEIPKLKVWSRSTSSPLESPQALTDDLPSFSLSPLTYITEIGDHLLTLPEQLEPFTSQDNPSLAAAMKHGRLPFTEDDGENRDLSLSDMWLDAIARGTMETYVESILKIPRLTDAAALQLSTDIGYLCNVLAALDQPPIPALTALEKLLKSDKETFPRFKDDKHTESALYQSIARLRTWD